MGKVLGYALIIAIFVAAAYFLAVGRGGGNLFNKKNANKTEQATISGTAATPTTKISIFAAGRPANNEYPTMELKIDGTPVQTWKGVKGDPEKGKFDEYSYNYPGLMTGQVLEVGFTNDLYIAADEDRDLYVDRIVVGDKTFVADSPATLTTITDKTNKRCSDGNTYSRWLRCNGYFTFRNYDQAFIPLPTPQARKLEGSVIKIYAGGKYIGGDLPMFNLNIKGKTVATFRAAGDQTLRILGEYSYMSWEKVKASDVTIVYTNDYYSKDGGDRNLYVDRINIDNVDYFGDAFSVYQTGVWVGGKCTEGYLRSKLLWCPNATMKFDARTQK